MILYSSIAISQPRTRNEVLYAAYRPNYYALYVILTCLLMTAFLLMSAILYFMRMHITPSKAHAQVNSS